MFCTYKDNAEPNIPVTKNTVEVNPLFDAPYFSTYLPKYPADKPKNKIAIEKVIVTANKLHCVKLIIGKTKTDHAYTLPIQMWIPLANMAISHLFLCNLLNNVKSPIPTNPNQHLFFLRIIQFCLVLETFVQYSTEQYLALYYV